MSGVVVLVIVSIASATLIILTAMVISLFKQIVRLAHSLAEMNEALRPLLEEIQAETGKAEGRLSRISEARTRFRGSERAR